MRNGYVNLKTIGTLAKCHCFLDKTETRKYPFTTYKFKVMDEFCRNSDMEKYWRKTKMILLIKILIYLN